MSDSSAEGGGYKECVLQIVGSRQVVLLGKPCLLPS
jgi:hypothetical protein